MPKTTEIIVLIIEVVVGGVLFVQFAQSNGWIAEHIPLPPFSLMSSLAYIVIVAMLLLIVGTPWFEILRRIINGRWVRDGFRLRYVLGSPWALRATSSRVRSFVRSVALLQETYDLPQTRKAIVFELRSKLLLICNEGNSWTKRERKAVQNLVHMIINHFSDDQPSYLDFLSIITCRNDRRTNQLIQEQFAANINTLWESCKVEPLDMPSMENIANTILCLHGYDSAELAKLAREVVHDTSEARYNALTSIIRKLAQTKNHRKLLSVSWDLLFQEMRLSEANKDENAVLRISELLKLLATDAII